jgi:hypothetical protein
MDLREIATGAHHMTNVLIFLITIVVSVLDPIRLLGYVLAGSFIRKREAAIAVGVLWMLAGHVFVAMPAARMYHSSIPLIQPIAAIIGAALATLAVHAIATQIRASKQTTPSDRHKQSVATQTAPHSGHESERTAHAAQQQQAATNTTQETLESEPKLVCCKCMTPIPSSLSVAFLRKDWCLRCFKIEIGVDPDK